MPAIFVTGDLFASDLEALAQGCNNMGAMGAGIAVTFKKYWPQMYKTYHERCKAGQYEPGDIFVWQGRKTTRDGEIDVTIFNLFTQIKWKASLTAIKMSVGKMIEVAHERGIRNIGMPQIGAGLGGLDWNRVKPLLQALGEQYDGTMVVFEQYQPGVSWRNMEPKS